MGIDNSRDSEPVATQEAGRSGADVVQGLEAPVAGAVGRIRRVTGEVLRVVVEKLARNGNGKKEPAPTKEELPPNMIAPTPPPGRYDSGSAPHCRNYDASPGFASNRGRTSTDLWERPKERDFIDLMTGA